MEDVLRKIKKALNLAHNNSNSEESQAALLLAQKLMLKHGLTASDIPNEKPKEKNVKRAHIRSSRIEWWYTKLSIIVANNFRCEHFYASGRYIGFLGLEDDVEIASEVFKFAQEAIRYHSSAYLKHKSFHRSRAEAIAIKNDYILGYLSGLREKFKEQVKSECLELVLVKDDAVIKAAEAAKFKEVEAKPVVIAGDYAARQQGYQDGKKFTKPNGPMIETK
ncbi:DUF2786 domain-containing protein [Paenibacillus elgii]|uniref:DUF2786 domain-containing protein n=1 Tax=Paenibacillus elgii TaxID=189691 RepID=UPI00203B4960|nr:DUF2786 domain-containing protein [Paenibacillus elgii]MCM3273682.1 DUF2786 domain-containing protein [Paenibacillus elgii]